MSIKDGVILPLNKNNQFYREFSLEIAKHCGVNSDLPWKKIREEKKKIILYGNGKIINFYNSYAGGVTIKFSMGY